MLTDRGRLNLIHPRGFPTSVRSTTWTNVCNASKVTGASMPFRADFEISVTETAQLEWNNTVKATFVLEGDGDSDIFAIDRITLQGSGEPRESSAFTTRSQCHRCQPGPTLISPLSMLVHERQVDQGGAGRLSMVRVAETRLRSKDWYAYGASMQN